MKYLNKTIMPDAIRTHDLCLRRATLYPAELRALINLFDNYIMLLGLEAQPTFYFTRNTAEHSSFHRFLALFLIRLVLNY